MLYDGVCLTLGSTCPSPEVRSAGRRVRQVLFLAWAPFFSGAERALLTTLGHLDRDRYEPFVLVGHDGELADNLRRSRIPHEVLPLEGIRRPRAIPGLVSALRVVRKAWRLGAQLIHANEVPAFEPGGYAARMLRIPAITHVRFPMDAPAYAWFLRSGFARAIFVSECSRVECMAAAPAAFEGKASVVYDGVLIPDDIDIAARTRVRSSLGLPLDMAIAGMVGQIAEVKGIWDFVEAARLVSSRQPRTMFVVVGDDVQNDGTLRREMESRVAAYGISDRFRFLGYHRDAAGLMPAFDVVAVPSHVEPLGLSALEAMAAGCGVVSSRVGGLLETVEDGKTGIAVSPRDPCSLADAIGVLVEDASLRSRLGTAARARVIERFSARRHAEVLQALYDDVIERYSLPDHTGSPTG